MCYKKRRCARPVCPSVNVIGCVSIAHLKLPSGGVFVFGIVSAGPLSSGYFPTERIFMSVNSKSLLAIRIHEMMSRSIIAAFVHFEISSKPLFILFSLNSTVLKK